MFALCSFSVSSLSEKRFVKFKIVNALIYKGLQPRTPVVRRWEAWKWVIGLKLLFFSSLHHVGTLLLFVIFAV
jgi:hypothetical protein